MCSLASDGIDRETMDMELGVIGCGNMGGSMVAHMLESGRNVHCYDPDSKALEGLKTLGAVGHISASDLAAECDVIVLSLPKADAVRAVMTEISSYLRPDSIILDTPRRPSPRHRRRCQHWRRPKVLHSWMGRLVVVRALPGRDP
jgi:6-phosphogluconate dehydrogenase (decarboxylating)